MVDRCPDASYLGNTMLKNWRLIFKSVATIEKDLGKYVPVGVFQITIECEKALDIYDCLLYTSPSPRDAIPSRMPSSA